MDGERTEYLRGFVHGMHFLLLAFDGRLMAPDLTREQVRHMLDEYYQLVEDYRDRFEAPAATAVALTFEDERPAN